MSEAVGLATDAEEFATESGLDFSYLLVIFQDTLGFTPEADLAAIYHEGIGSPSYPVMADVSGTSVAASPYDATGVPGKCALTPDMVILGCTTGHGAAALYQLIEEHAAGQ
ncbi:MAG: hypothetical protein JRI68_06560 [Deltaproteobacteria bacterium]|nr:hypothetical protein [Deltaproteobacteria bacterium]